MISKGESDKKKLSHQYWKWNIPNIGAWDSSERNLLVFTANLHDRGMATSKDETETITVAVNTATERILTELQSHAKETTKRFDTLDASDEEIKKLQKQLIEKTKKIEELNNDIKEMLKLLENDISNPKQIHLYNFEMLFGIVVIVISLAFFSLYQSIPLLILLLITGVGIITTSFFSKRKVIEIRKECGFI